MKFLYPLSAVSAAASLAPIVIIPGHQSSTLFISGTNVSVPPCGASPISFPSYPISSVFGVALPPEVAASAPDPSACLRAILMLTYSNGLYQSLPGLHVQPAFLNTSDPGPSRAEGSYAALLETLKVEGYKEGQNVFGFPYDWRLPPWQLSFNALKDTIEKAVVDAGGKKAIVLAHSLGGLTSTYFLQKTVDAEWKDLYIGAYIPVNSAQLGAVEAVVALLSGHTAMLPVSLASDPAVGRAVLRSFGSSYVLTPYPGVVMPVAEIMPSSSWGWDWIMDAYGGNFTHPTRTYSSVDWGRLLDTEEGKRLEDAQSRLGDVPVGDPGVETYCMWSVLPGATTVELVKYKRGGRLGGPKELNDIEMTRGIGDGLLTVDAVKACQGRMSTLISTEFSRLDHSSVLGNPMFINHVLSIVNSVTAA